MPDKKFLLISSKLNRPDIGSRNIIRPRLITRLNKGLDKRITLISAPAGFGKTTLAVQWLDQSPLRSAWLSLEKDDGEPERFLRYVVAAIRTAVPDFCEKVWGLLSAVQLPPPEYLADAMISEIRTLDSPFVFVLDDYYFIKSEPVQDMVVRMIQNLPRNFHLVVLTRLDPPWPLSRWRSQDLVNELRTADLRFSEDETRIFFSKQNFAPETVDALHKQSEGWIAGLQLMKLSLDDAGDPVRLTRTSSDNYRLIVDYLMDEVISRQPRDIITFLSITALLDRFSAPLFDFVLANADAGVDGEQLLARLEQENLFLVPLDRERRWYRYHRLFRDLLRDKLTNRLSHEQRAHLLRRAGEWFAQEGLVKEAIAHYLDAGDIDAAAALVEEHLHTIIDTDLSRRSLKRLLDLFPPQAEITRPALLIAHAYVQLFNWNFPVVKKLHARTDELLRAAGNTIPEAYRLNIQGDMEAQRSFYLYQLGEVKESLESARNALKLVPKEHIFAHGLAIIYTVAGYAANGRKEQAFRFLEKAVTGSADSGSRFVGQGGLVKMVIDYNAGDLNSVRETADAVLARHEQVQVPDYYLAFPHYFKGAMAYELNRLPAATRHFETVVGMRYFVMPSLYHDCLVGLALVALARGEADHAKELVHAATVQAREANDSYVRGISDGLSARLVDQGRDSQRTALPSPQVFESVRFLLFTPSLIRLESEILREQPADCRTAIPLLDAGIAQAGQVHNRRQVIQFLTLKAVALKCAGWFEEALRVLHETLDMARPLGFVRTFLDRGPHMAELMRSLLKKSPHDAYLRDLVDAFAAERSRDSQVIAVHKGTSGVMQMGKEVSTVPLPDLSNRELHVLALLEQGLSNKEIAERLYVSPDTVRKHTINIYRKLEVNKRTKAVAAARQLGILPSK